MPLLGIQDALVVFGLLISVVASGLAIGFTENYGDLVVDGSIVPELHGTSIKIRGNYGKSLLSMEIISVILASVIFLWLLLNAPQLNWFFGITLLVFLISFVQSVMVLTVTEDITRWEQITDSETGKLRGQGGLGLLSWSSISVIASSTLLFAWLGIKFAETRSTKRKRLVNMDYTTLPVFGVLSRKRR